jgi:hypothetical protein
MIFLEVFSFSKVSTFLVWVLVIIFHKIIKFTHRLWAKDNIPWLWGSFLKFTWNSIKLSLIISIRFFPFFVFIFLVLVIYKLSLLIFTGSLIVIIIRIWAELLFHGFFYHLSPLFSLYLTLAGIIFRIKIIMWIGSLKRRLCIYYWLYCRNWRITIWKV